MSAGALPIIRVQNLEKVYPGNVHAVRGVSFEVRPKQVVAIIGSSGSGKSTVLRCINRLIEPTEGEIYLEEVKINDQKTDINKISSEIGMVFQSFELFAHLRVLENVTLGMRKVRGYSRAEAKKIACGVLEKVDMLDKLEAFPGQISGGQMQRVAIGWLAWELTQSTAWLGVVAAANLLPAVFVGPFAGAIADRADRLRVVTLTQKLLMVQAVALFVLNVSGLISIEALVGLVAFHGVVVGFNLPANKALVPSLVPRDDLPTALAGKTLISYAELDDGPERREDAGCEDDGVVMFTTSGTTAAPKLVLHSQRGIVRHARDVAAFFGWNGDGAVLLQALPLCGVFGHSQAMATLAAGAPMLSMPVFSGPEAARLMRAHQVTPPHGPDARSPLIPSTVPRAPNVSPRAGT